MVATTRLVVTKVAAANMAVKRAKTVAPDPKAVWKIPQLPKFPWRQWLVRWDHPLRIGCWAVALVLVSALLLHALNGALGVRAWQVQSGDSALQVAISAQLRKMAPLDFLDSRPQLLAQRLRNLEPDIAKLEIARRLPHSLLLQAAVRVPVALWARDDGRVWLVDGSGVAYRPIHRSEHLNLPLLRCESAQEAEKMVVLMHQMGLHDGELLSEISELVVEDGVVKVDMNRGAQWIFPLDGKMAARVAQIRALLARAPWNHGAWKIDARQQDRWFVRAGSGAREVI